MPCLHIPPSSPLPLFFGDEISLYIGQAGLELMVIPPALASWCRGYRHESLHPTLHLDFWVVCSKHVRLLLIIWDF